MRRAKVDALLLTNRFNVRYLSGFTGEDSFLLIEPRRETLLTDGRFIEQSRLECLRAKIVIRTGRMVEALAGLLKGRAVRRLGVEADDMTLALKAGIEKGLKRVRLKPLGGGVSALREAKDAGEVAAIVRAIRVAEEGLLALIRGGARSFVGRTERQVAAELEYRMRLAGADGPAFESIVAAGPHGALPHYRSGDTRIRRGDPVLIDWGALVGGYCSDLTRVVFTGTIPPPIRRIYEVVKRAQAAAIAAVTAGAACRAADGAARGVIVSAGFGDAFTHGTGHGVGLEIHESPGLGRTSKQRLSAGMVVTVEPGIYLPGVGGVRIEDDVLVTESGRRRLSRLPRELDAWMVR